MSERAPPPHSSPPGPPPRPEVDPIVTALGPGSSRPLVEVLDQVLHTGIVLDGQIVLSVAGVDLVHIGLRALLASVDTATRAALRPLEPPA